MFPPRPVSAGRGEVIFPLPIEAHDVHIRPRPVTRATHVTHGAGARMGFFEARPALFRSR